MFVISKNQMHRPALTGEQKVKLYQGLKVQEEIEAEKRTGGDRKSEKYNESKNQGVNVDTMKGKARDLAAHGAGISTGTAAKIDYVAKHDADLIPLIESGDMTVNGAYNKAKDERATVVEEFVPTPEYKEMIERNRAIVTE
jgi:hypothetical protein